MDRLLDLIMDHAISFTRAERGFLILRDTVSRNYDIRVARNIGKEVIDHPMFKVSRGIIDRTWEGGSPLVLDSAKDDIEFGARGSVVNLQLASVASLPLKWKGETVGVLYLDNRFRKGLFEPADLLLLELFADEAASAIAHIRLTAELERKNQELELLNAQLRASNRDLEARVEETDRKVKELETELKRKKPKES
jgi:GAF domain-containing protein